MNLPIFKNCDNVLQNNKKSVLKFAEKNFQYRFKTKSEFINYIYTLSCDEILNKYDVSRVKIDFFNEDPSVVFNNHHKVKNCKNNENEFEANDKKAFEFAINYIIKIADKLDSKNFTNIVNILDNTLEKINKLYNCKNCL
jgi:hypothetical protein